MKLLEGHRKTVGDGGLYTMAMAAGLIARGKLIITITLIFAITTAITETKTVELHLN
jgi:hypothetical protein